MDPPWRVTGARTRSPCQPGRAPGASRLPLCCPGVAPLLPRPTVTMVRGGIDPPTPGSEDRYLRQAGALSSPQQVPAHGRVGTRKAERDEEIVHGGHSIHRSRHQRRLDFTRWLCQFLLHFHAVQPSGKADITNMRCRTHTRQAVGDWRGNGVYVIVPDDGHRRFRRMRYETRTILRSGCFPRGLTRTLPALGPRSGRPTTSTIASR